MTTQRRLTQQARLALAKAAREPAERPQAPQYRVRHKTEHWEGRLVRTDGRIALVKWDNQSPALLIAAGELECLSFPAEKETRQ